MIRDVINNRTEEIARLLKENPLKCVVSDPTRRTPLHLAAWLGRTEIVELFLKHECYSVNCRDTDLITPLHRACRNNHHETVAKLLQSNADVNTRSRLHTTPLHICCSFDALESAKLIVGSVSNINATDSNGITALHYAVFRGCVPMIELLLKHGASPDVQDKNGQRPIHFAAISDSAEAIRLLVQAGSDVNSRNKDLLTPLHFAIASKSQNAFLGLVELKANLEAQDIHGNMPSHWAASMGCNIIFDEIVKRGVPITAPNLSGITPLHYAAGSQHSYQIALKIMKSIAQVDIVDKFNRTPLHYAALYGCDETAIELINGANCDFADENLETPLHKAIINSHMKMIALLIEHGAKVDIGNRDGFTPLHFSVINGLPWNCNWLINAGANPLQWDSSGRTPHYLAVFKGVLDCFLCLMASPHYKLTNGQLEPKISVFPELDAFKRSLLHYAAASNTCTHEFVEILLLRRRLNAAECKVPQEVINIFEDAFSRFDINQKDIYGRTPLHYVCMREIDIESDVAFLVEIMIEAGADISIIDNEHKLPFHYAIANGYNNILDMLFRNNWIQNPTEYRRLLASCCPLIIAAYYGNCAAICKLINHGFRSYERSIEIATRRNNWTCVLKLKQYASTRALSQKLALIAVQNGQSNGLRIFLSCPNLDLDHLWLAAAGAPAGTSCLEALIENQRGINIHLRDRNGRNALFYAVVGGSMETVKLLLVSGIRLVRDTIGKNVFHLVASQGNIDMFRLFHTLARENGFFGHMCTYLLTKDDDGFTPIETACVKGHQAILEYYVTNLNKGFEQKLTLFARYDFLFAKWSLFLYLKSLFYIL